mgnify:CR=1 FL=1
MLLILDEVQTGLCRTGRIWAFEHFGVVPDALVIAISQRRDVVSLSGEFDFAATSRVGAVIKALLTAGRRRVPARSSPLARYRKRRCNESPR